MSERGKVANRVPLPDLSLVGQLVSQGSLGQGRSALELSMLMLQILRPAGDSRQLDDKVLLEDLAPVLLAAFIALGAAFIAFIALGAICTG